MTHRAPFIRMLTLAAWRVSPQAQAEAAARFAEVERDSAHQFAFAAQQAEDVTVKAQLMLNSMEEHRHAQLFEGFARSQGVRPIPATSRHRLIDELGGLPRFLAYAHVAEQAVYADFAAYARASNLPAFRTLFEHIRADEREHGAGCLDMLERTRGAESLTRLLLRARSKRFYEGLLRISEAVGACVGSILLVLVYFLFSAFAYRAARRRLGTAASATGARSLERSDAQARVGILNAASGSKTN